MAMVLLQWCGEISLTLDQAAKTIEYSTEKKILQWISHGRMLRGWALAHSGKVDRGVDLLRQGLAEWQAMGARRSLTYYLLILAETYSLSGRIEEGLNAVGGAQAIIAEGGERWLEAELFRRQGELLLAREADGQDVEACFQRALEIARLQQARSLELRAATSLSRLWQRQGKYTVARKMLAKSYNWFTEGFDTADLRQARALLDAMG
jgi:predicted ATPase